MAITTNVPPLDVATLQGLDTMGVEERTITGDDIIGVRGKVTIKFGEDDYVELGNSELRAIFGFIEMDVEYRTGAGVPRRVKNWVMSFVTSRGY